MAECGATRLVFVPRARVVATAMKKRSAKKRATCSLAAAMVVGGGALGQHGSRGQPQRSKFGGKHRSCPPPSSTRRATPRRRKTPRAASPARRGRITPRTPAGPARTPGRCHVETRLRPSFQARAHRRHGRRQVLSFAPLRRRRLHGELHLDDRRRLPLPHGQGRRRAPARRETAAAARPRAPRARRPPSRRATHRAASPVRLEKSPQPLARARRARAARPRAASAHRAAPQARR